LTDALPPRAVLRSSWASRCISAKWPMANRQRAAAGLHRIGPAVNEVSRMEALGPGPMMIKIADSGRQAVAPRNGTTRSDCRAVDGGQGFFATLRRARHLAHIGAVLLSLSPRIRKRSRHMLPQRLVDHVHGPVLGCAILHSVLSPHGGLSRAATLRRAFRRPCGSQTPSPGRRDEGVAYALRKLPVAKRGCQRDVAEREHRYSVGSFAHAKITFHARLVQHNILCLVHRFAAHASIMLTQASSLLRQRRGQRWRIAV
jgi:hypothetical protein